MVQLEWQPRWDFRQAMTKTAEWYRAYFTPSDVSLRDLTLRHINEYMQMDAK